MGKQKFQNNHIFHTDVGDLKLLRRLETSDLGRFRCHCGEIFEAKITSVSFGKTKSCGCYRREIATKSIKNINNKNPKCSGNKEIKERTRYDEGHLFKNEVGVLRIVKRVKGTEGRIAKFICFCGNEFEARVDNVASGNTKSCGCYRQSKMNPYHVIFEQDDRRNTQSYLFRYWMYIRNTHYNRLHPTWHSYKIFSTDIISGIGQRPSQHHILRRKDEESDYVLANMTWVDKTSKSEKVTEEQRKAAAVPLRELVAKALKEKSPR